MAAENWINRGCLNVIGTRGTCRYDRDFIDVRLHMHGEHETVDRAGPYDGKKLDVMIDCFTRSLDADRDLIDRHQFRSAEDAGQNYKSLGVILLYLFITQ